MTERAPRIEEIERLRSSYRSLREEEERWERDFYYERSRESLEQLNNTRDKIKVIAEELGGREVVNLDWQIEGERKERQGVKEEVDEGGESG